MANSRTAEHGHRGKQKQKLGTPPEGESVEENWFKKALRTPSIEKD